MVAVAANVNLYQLEFAAVTETLVIEYILQLRIDRGSTIIFGVR